MTTADNSKVARFTPGPWAAEFTDVPYSELEGGAWTVEQDGNSICTLDGPADANEANARLIAAAPEMFEALRTLVGYARWQMMEGADHHPSLPSAIQQAEAALTKAVGGDTP